MASIHYCAFFFGCDLNSVNQKKCSLTHAHAHCTHSRPCDTCTASFTGRSKALEIPTSARSRSSPLMYVGKRLGRAMEPVQRPLARRFPHPRNRHTFSPYHHVKHHFIITLPSRSSSFFSSLSFSTRPFFFFFLPCDRCTNCLL